MSPSLLSKRLSELEEAGIVRRHRLADGEGHEYLLTDAGRELEGIIMAMAVWGQHWARDMEVEDLDPGFLIWSMHLRIDTRAMPTGRTVLEFEFSGAPKDCSRYWLVHQDGEVEMCLKDPGLDVDLVVSSDLRLFIEAWRGFRDLREEIRRKRIQVLGPQELCRQFPDWLLLSAFAPYARKRPGRERTMARRNVRKKGSQPVTGQAPG